MRIPVFKHRRLLKRGLEKAKQAVAEAKKVRIKEPTTPRITGPKIDKRHKIGAAEWLSNGQWALVRSSNVKGISYEWGTKQLFVEFKGYKGGPTSVYVYYQVPSEVAQDMFRSSSMGKFVHYQLKNKYEYRRLR